MPAAGNLAALTARTATNTTDIIQPIGANGVIVVINCTAIVTAPSVVFKIQGVIFPTGPNGTAVVWDLLASAAVVAPGVTILEVNPSLTAVTNRAANAQLPDRFQVVATHANGNSITYSVTAILTP